MSSDRRIILTLCIAFIAACGSSDNYVPAGLKDLEFVPKGDEARGQEDYAWSQQSGEDQQSHPDYNQRTAPLITPFFESDGQDRRIYRDPYHYQWLEQARGTYESAQFANRYGAMLQVDFYGPPEPFTDRITGNPDTGPYPVVLLIPGYAADVLLYEGHAQQMAENGYIVVMVTPQGQIPSETEPNPHEQWCDPDGEWRQPQEGGVQESGECAGYDPTPGDRPPVPTRFANDDEANAAFSTFEENYSTYFRARYAFATLDLANWLESGESPWTERMDFNRIGIMGHSAGADGALVAANVDPLQRFSVVAVWDSYGQPPTHIPFAVPTMFQFSEQQPGLYPYPQDWDPMLHPGVVNSLRALQAGTPMMSIGLRGSSHAEWHYVPYRLQNPVAPFTNASAKGFQVSHYYTRAWMDYHLKGNSIAHRTDAERRLLARTFDDSVDWTSISTGTYNPETNGNNPYLIEGEPITDHITVWYPNMLFFGGHFCLDWHEGCTSE